MTESCIFNFVSVPSEASRPPRHAAHIRMRLSVTGYAATSYRARPQGRRGTPRISACGGGAYCRLPRVSSSYIYLYLFLFLYLYLHLYVSISIYINIYLSIYLSMYLSIGGLGEAFSFDSSREIVSSRSLARHAHHARTQDQRDEIWYLGSM